jgi:ElaB/YqjD/DUF883 family membrane-anchored ribosome-binding protein
MSDDPTRNSCGDGPQTGDADQPQQGADESFQGRCAAEAVRRAKAELKKAQELYEQVRRQAAEQMEAVRKTTFGELIDGTKEFVRKHPGPGVFVAAAAGFILGRIFRGRP